MADLWVQQRSQRGEVHYEKLNGKANTSDMLTKAVERDVITKHMSTLGLEFRSGRHQCTPAYNKNTDTAEFGTEEK